MQDRDIQRVYRPCDSNKAQLIPPDQAYCDAGNVNGAGECIYHKPTSRWYARIEMKISKGTPC